MNFEMTLLRHVFTLSYTMSLLIQPQRLIAQVQSLTNERDEIEKKLARAEYACGKYHDDLKLVESEVSALQKSMVCFRDA